MRYTLWSRDRMLGETGLDYVRCMPKHRMGDLIPTAIGERLLASEVHMDSLGLELRDPDGNIVPVEWIDVRDAEYAAEVIREFDDDDPYIEDDPKVLASVEQNAAQIHEWLENEPKDFWRDYKDAGERPWMENPSYPHYQIQVRLLDDAAIP